MAEIIDFKSEKKRIQKKWEEEIDAEIKNQGWYIEAKRKLQYKIECIKYMLLIDAIIVVAIFLVNMI